MEHLHLLLAVFGCFRALIQYRDSTGISRRIQDGATNSEALCSVVAGLQPGRAGPDQGFSTVKLNGA